MKPEKDTKWIPAKKIFEHALEASDGELRQYQVGGEKFMVKIGRPTLRTFALNPSCVCCGVTGNYFAITSPGNKFTNPTRYGVSLFHKSGNSAIRMTLDHIVPKSKGGKNDGNLQVMCELCNQLKSDRTISLDELAEEVLAVKEMTSSGMGRNSACKKVLEKWKERGEMTGVGTEICDTTQNEDALACDDNKLSNQLGEKFLVEKNPKNLKEMMTSYLSVSLAIASATVDRKPVRVIGLAENLVKNFDNMTVKSVVTRRAMVEKAVKNIEEDYGGEPIYKIIRERCLQILKFALYEVEVESEGSTTNGNSKKQKHNKRA